MARPRVLAPSDADVGDVEAFCRLLHVRVCPLYRYENKRPFLVGTAIPFACPEGHFLLTASHVLSELPSHNIVTAGSSSLIRFPASSHAFGYAPRKSIDVDVAVIQLPAVAAEDLAKRYSFSTPEQLGTVAVYDRFTLYVVVGYPHSRNRSYPKAQPELIATPTFIVLREFLDVDRFQNTGKRPNVHFALAAPAHRLQRFDGDKLTLPKLQGMSGGGVWKLVVNRQDGTIADTALVGIAIEHRKPDAAIVITRIQYALPLIGASTAPSTDAPEPTGKQP